MKNKKLFAILTLVCFMMTLMPVAAFAGPNAGLAEVSSVYTTDENASEKVQVKANGDADASKANLGIKFDFDAATNITTTVYVWFVKDGSNVPVVNVAGDINGKTDIPGVFTGEVTQGTEYKFAFANSGKYKVYASFNDPSDVKDESTTAGKISNVEDKLGSVTNHQSFEITSSSSSSDYGTTLSGTGAAVAAYGDQSTDWTAKTYVGDGGKYTIDGITANNVSEQEYTVKLVDAQGKAVKGQTVTLETNSSNIELNKEKATTDQLGQIKFKITGVKDGEYKVYIKAGSYEATITVTVGATGAYDIVCVKSPSAPIDVTDDLGKKIQFTFSDANGNAVTTTKAADAGATAAFRSDGNNYGVAITNKDNETIGYENLGSGITNAKPYVAIVSQPSASDLENADLLLEPADDNAYRANLALASTSDDLAEGTYTIKVVLDNGKYTTVTFEVKEFTTPVALNLTYEADAVELNSSVAIDTLEWVDANGVTKDATGKVDLAATGYAVLNFVTEDGRVVSHYVDKETGEICGENDKNAKPVHYSAGTVLTKSDDKYVGQTITVVAVDDRYNLTANATLTVADEASELAFDTKTLAVNANNKVGVAVVDSQGNKVALNRGAGATATISYVVLDKPEGAKVSVSTDGSDNNILTEGTFKMNVTSNTVGNVTIQAVAKVTYTSTENQATVVKYYTGTQIFAVGKDSVGQVVVMSIGSNEIIINDAKGTIDAAPMIQNDRTYVPFRALAEAFGAEVAYDEATQAVTAELNGVTVVMTIGSATYTVNGTEQTMDVAPFITGSRTMIPVRFAAEAFGIKVIPTYNPDGSTADILFNL